MKISLPSTVLKTATFVHLVFLSLHCNRTSFTGSTVPPSNTVEAKTQGGVIPPGENGEGLTPITQNSDVIPVNPQAPLAERAVLNVTSEVKKEPLYNINNIGQSSHGYFTFTISVSNLKAEEAVNSCKIASISKDFKTLKCNKIGDRKADQISNNTQFFKESCRCLLAYKAHHTTHVRYSGTTLQVEVTEQAGNKTTPFTDVRNICIFPSKDNTWTNSSEDKSCNKNGGTFPFVDNIKTTETAKDKNVVVAPENFPDSNYDWVKDINHFF